ncbi:response regulator [Pseudoalteromonas fuliginea]|uniref:Chemotaxis protein CheY n=1 Tax=Pseudoalteromonas fuliginea TaxID=1872678 RepID=A0ABD3Y7H6_9GAMM|nr:response regulator [Pseudoalteromonas fuliginea]KAA1152872.1 response regulator [Pseudoalteromonas fuliginea]KAA1166476.1 response regulator [Pseudoalteromonas fuliginea]KDC50370.1 chemotaxis protein CheY [Pseudoalteromonas fuliginea]KJZ24883.1 chemotaxis protein CheY [Pseudoalteromonas fuliginea]
MKKVKPPILIIDDNEVDRYILKRLIKEANLELTIFEKKDGQEALEFLENYEANKKEHPDGFPPILIFLDINMPRVNGIQFLDEFAKLRKVIEISSCVVMMFSSSEREEEKKIIMAHDFVKGYLVKGSFKAEDLKEKVLSAIDTPIQGD